ncbi:hypothetical protein CPB84DRAFT_4529 [Gymnopilus junonius]|uniref:Uncharacterized protein n=1 Tax=Gymnopilus junonius TaxID=109634 RepID=A0A9P5P2S9_GYMJU|nr:hypothetical protein CPB84DRAFT_4529 [Gymnopilus junonius]
MHQMQRPGPLQELPLEHFLQPLNPNVPVSSKQTIGNKRQLSPGRPSLFSPTKRRILNDEGIHLPEKTIKAPLPSSRTASMTPSVRLSHPDSPARVLHFGLPKNLQGDPQKRPVHKGLAVDMAFIHEPSSSSSRLVSSPELKPKTTPRISTRRSQDAHPQNRTGFEDVHVSSSSANLVIPSFVPRELPPQTDPGSIHFPGFFVYQDTQVAVYPTAMMEANEVCKRDPMVDSDTHKENLPPRRRTKKLSVVSSASDLKSNSDAYDRRAILNDDLALKITSPYPSPREGGRLYGRH